MKLKGPDLKMSETKVPGVVSDVYRDLRDRRLLPLVALVLVAIVAVPFLLGSDSEVPSERDAAAAGVGEPDAQVVGGGAAAAGLRVVEATPGLRDYHKRLDDRSPTDPFKQRHTGLPKSARLTESSGGSGGEGDGGDTGSGAPEASTRSPSSSADGGISPQPSQGEGGQGGSGGGSGGATRDLVEFAVDVQVSRSEPGAREDNSLGKPRVRRRVRPLQSLPGPKAPVVTVMGINLRTLRVMFLVSDRARKLGGEFRCRARAPKGVCELLEVEPGLPFEVVYGPKALRYRFKVTAVDAIPAGKVGGGRDRRDGFVGDLKDGHVAP